LSNHFLTFLERKIYLVISIFLITRLYSTSPSTRATHGVFLHVIFVVIAMLFWIFNNLYDENLMFLKDVEVYQ